MATASAPNPTPPDRNPPHNVEAERSLLGAVLISPDAMVTAIEVLGRPVPGLFYHEPHRHIYAAAFALVQQDMPVDSTTLLTQLTKDDKLEAAGGGSYISELSSVVPTAANVAYYARIVQETALLRRLIKTCTFIAGEAYQGQGDVSEMLDRAESAIYSLNEERQASPIYRVGDLVDEGALLIQQQIEQGKAVTGLPSGYTDLDKLLSGFQKADMVILAARPSVGKTALALNIAANLLTEDPERGVLLFSIEMAKEQLVQRMLCMVGRVSSRKLKDGFLVDRAMPKVREAAEMLRNANLYIDESADLNVLDLRSKARRHAAQNRVDMIIIDYLQLMRGLTKFETRQLEIAEISRSIKALARELRVPVLALSQLSREAEKDESGGPKLSHLRESGAIEQDADVVLMLSRPRIDKRRTQDADDDEEVDENIVQVSVKKHRNGPTGMVKLYFDKDLQRFQNLLEGGAPPSAPPEPAYDAYDYGDDAYSEDDIGWDEDPI